MNNLLKISVVTPCFNSEHTIRETLQSVASQDYPNFEHLVMDGGSKDGTRDIIRQFPKVISASEPDEGHYHAMDKGIRRATGDVFGILNSDDFYRPGALAKVAEGFEANPDCDALFGDVVFVDGEGKEIFRREEAMFDRQVVRYGQHSTVHHQALFVRREVYLRLGGYRYKEFKNVCDFDFLMRMIAANCRIRHIPALVVNFRYHEHGQSVDRRIIANMAAESARIRAEHGVPGGFAGKVLYTYARIKRQVEKLLILGKCDLVPGRWMLNKHYKDKATFSSNAGLDKL